MATAATKAWRDESVEILTQQQVAEWLLVKPRQIGRLGIPCLDLGHKTKRYLKQAVRDWIDAQRRPQGRAA